ncbi:heavy metal transport/detoxification protein [Panacibacter ginsenosidivorans]|uniref:Heavy metal transport/detoxification protein n=1 Tax=Panacibacter ginsenosidivorans TaxID=1813871 RepID=A0A5B8V3M3_9BACT|nr:heavy metal transport/detoxification protein [Panacibacter ginsenosidivorans]QEC65802.1 heavy metal transport/detoxification protein [Panacibacter ginsenosidivorans]
METLKFKTTIKCTGCVNKVTPFLNEAAGEDNWEVDLQNADKTLTVAAGEKTTADKVINALEQAGYKGERIN